MLSKLTLLSLVFTIFVVAACQSTAGHERRTYLTPEANSVRVIKHFPANCKPAGSIMGWGAARANGKTVWTFAMNDMRNKAAAQGFTTVILERYKHASEGGVLSVKVFGKLMRCGKSRAGDNGAANDGEDTGYTSVKPTPPPATTGGVGTPKSTTPPADPDNGNGAPPVNPPADDEF